MDVPQDGVPNEYLERRAALDALETLWAREVGTLVFGFVRHFLFCRNSKPYGSKYDWKMVEFLPEVTPPKGTNIGFFVILTSRRAFRFVGANKMEGTAEDFSFFGCGRAVGYMRRSDINLIS